jgi:beta-1,4-N-acetylglucosaminyltransferase
MTPDSSLRPLNGSTYHADHSKTGRRCIELLLVCTTGGHLLQLLALRPVWATRSRLWVTHAGSDAASLLQAERVVNAYSPTTRNLRNLLRNLHLAWSVVSSERPKILITTGAGVAVPFAWVARLRGARIVYVESITRTHGLSLSARLVAPIADRLYVQWPEVAEANPRTIYCGNLLPK